jgi:hypothetical protein
VIVPPLLLKLLQECVHSIPSVDIRPDVRA